jgi:uncharacterized membrane protein
MTTLPPEDNSAQGAAQPEQPAQPTQPAPPQQPAAPQYQAPQPAAPQFEAPPGYPQQPAPVAANPVSNLQLNYWLSVFFTWLPALIFWLIEKDKGDQRATKLHVDNFNFSLLRTIAYLAIIVIGWIPYIGWIIAILLWLAQIVLFVFHIIAATKVKTSYETDGKDPFIFNIPMVK